MNTTGENILETRDVAIHFGGITALEAISIDVRRGEIYGLVGPNGAGKTTLLNAVSGVAPLTGGRVTFNGRDITAMPLHARAGIGIGRTFQGVELFHDLNVQENLMVGLDHLSRTNVLTGGLFFGPARKEEIAHRRRVEEVIEFFELERHRKKPVGTLAYGIQKLVGMARALCGEPRILLLDEVGSGLNREEKEDLARFLLRIKHTLGVTMLWIEHDVGLVSDLADTVSVLDYGHMVMTGEPETVLHDPSVREVFVGSTASTHAAAPAAQTSDVEP